MEIYKMNRVLSRYSQKCVADRLDPDFAKALEELKTNFKDCRNELCMKCEGYKTAHLGSCDDCRWRDT